MTDLVTIFVISLAVPQCLGREKGGLECIFGHSSPGVPRRIVGQCRFLEGGSIDGRSKRDVFLQWWR